MTSGDLARFMRARLDEAEAEMFENFTDAEERGIWRAESRSTSAQIRAQRQVVDFALALAEDDELGREATSYGGAILGAMVQVYRGHPNWRASWDSDEEGGLILDEESDEDWTP